MLKNVENGSCRFYYANDNRTLLAGSKLVATREDLTKIKNLLTNTGVTESCTREPTNTKWKFYKLTNFLIFAALWKGVPMGCKDTVLPNPLLKNHSVENLKIEKNTRKPYNKNLGLLKSLALHFHGNERLEEETFKNFNPFLETIGGIDPASSQNFCVEESPTVEHIVQEEIFLYVIDLVDGSMTGELARSVRKYSITMRLLR